MRGEPWLTWDEASGSYWALSCGTLRPGVIGSVGGFGLVSFVCVIRLYLCSVCYSAQLRCEAFYIADAEQPKNPMVMATRKNGLPDCRVFTQRMPSDVAACRAHNPRSLNQLAQ